MSPNDIESAIATRDKLSDITDHIFDLEIGEDAGWYDAPNGDPAQWMEDYSTICRKLLRVWLKDTEKEFSTDERHRLIRLTEKVLRVMETETD